ncbi:exodeoxyribonuclease V subunit alpha [Shewanella gelidii]|nr:exodeoxyribonuclease V subunit alpha [Shewanella gelidii]MCL1098167.1 exodeoxyribonuclease V subunit alpha [Shewanella gelidii]
MHRGPQVKINTPESMTQLIKRWQQEKLITPLDRHFALEMAALHQEDSPLFLLISVLVSQQLSTQHTCLVLDHVDFSNPLHERQSSCYITLSKEQLHAALLRFAAISQGVGLTGKSEAIPQTPLILEQNRLYLNRYYCYEFELAAVLKRLNLNEQNNQTLAKQSSIDQQPLALLFPEQGLVTTGAQPANVEDFDWQKIAVATALQQQLAIITGGPGTGKTTTVTKLLCLLVLEYQQQTSTEYQTSKAPFIKLVAPTGKAAARLSESIKASKQRLKSALSNIQESHLLQQLQAAALQIPETTSTIHRLLGVIPNSPQFRHHPDNPLRLDVLIVDEASMVDLPMMFKLLSALPKHAKVILLGDQDQLASVEAGAVLADICQGLKHAVAGRNIHQWKMRYSSANIEQLHRLTNYDLQQYACESVGIGDSLVMLLKSHRFEDDEGIGQLAKAVNQSDAITIQKVWQHNYKELLWIEHTDQTSLAPLTQHNKATGLTRLLDEAIDNYGLYLDLAKQKGSDPMMIIESYNRYRVLCAMRAGPFGVDGINQAISQALTDKNLIQPNSEFYLGRPIMIQNNDYNLELFNGDIGLILYDNTQQNRLMAHFIKADGSILKVLPARLPSHQTCFAMTVHKSQGSEFANVALVLPEKPSPSQTQLLTKELIYTAITRAKLKFSCLGSAKVFEKASLRATQRASGLAQRLWETMD